MLISLAIDRIKTKILVCIILSKLKKNNKFKNDGKKKKYINSEIIYYPAILHKK